MSKTLLEKMIVDETKNLSVDILIEILDFVQFLKAKRLGSQRNKSLKMRVKDELSGLNAMSLVHLEEEFADYREQFPHES